MIKTVPATNIGLTGPEAVAYGLFIHPSEVLQNEITKLLKALETELPGVIWAMPPATLHFTLYEIIQPKAYSEDKEILYMSHQREYEKLPAKILSSIKPIEVNFNTIEASPWSDLPSKTSAK